MANRIPPGLVVTALLIGGYGGVACLPHPEPVIPAAERAEQPSSAPVRTAKPAPGEPSTAREAVACDVVCEGAKIISHEITPEESADHYTRQAVEQANRSLDGMHDDLLACYAARVKESPKAHAFLVLDVLIGPDGHVRSVVTEGGALLGERALACITDRVKSGEFAPPHGGGTMRIEVPLTLRTVPPDEAI